MQTVSMTNLTEDSFELTLLSIKSESDVEAIHKSKQSNYGKVTYWREMDWARQQHNQQEVHFQVASQHCPQGGQFLRPA